MVTWFYCDPKGEQKCLPERILLNLLTTEVGGSLTSGGRASAWTEGMSGWAPLRECPVFKEVCSLYHETLWFVSRPEPMGISEAVSTATIIKWLRSGAMTPDTLVHNKAHTGDGWVAAGQVTSLRGLGGAGPGGAAPAADDDDDAIPQEALAALAQADSSAANATAINKASAARADKYTKEGSGGGSEGGEGAKKKRKRSKPKTNWVYVEGLPSDVTEDEVKKHFSLVGLIAINMDDQSPKIKIYRDAQNPAKCKGDASLCYHAATSVEMALTILDGGAIRPTHTIKVSRAKFTAAPVTDASADVDATTAVTADADVDADADSAPPRKVVRAIVGIKDDKESKEQRVARAKISRAAMQQALSWDDDHESLTHAPTHILRIVILENMFTPSDFDDPTFSDELENDVAQGCGAMGTIEKITFFSKHPDGVVAVKFLSANAAADCVAKMHGRFFGGRKLKASYWDRITDYTSVQAEEVVAQEQEQEEKRQQEFGAWLEDQVDLPDELRLQVES